MKIRFSLILAILVFSNVALAKSMSRYEVKITNITRGQTFTPQLVTVHKKSMSLFSLGEPASDAIAILAESGNPGPLSDDLLADPSKKAEVKIIDGLLGPGMTATVEIEANRYLHSLSMAAMLIPTNDTFVALSGVRLPRRGSVSYIALAYDAGTEENDQNCANIPGPRCGGAALSSESETDEGYIYVSNGFHDLGTEDENGNEILGPRVYDWRNPIAQVTITKVK